MYRDYSDLDSSDSNVFSSSCITCCSHRYGLDRDRMDQSAVGHDYQSDLSAHSSQTDHSRGFGGRYGVERDRVDQSAGSFADMTDVKSAPKPEVC